MTLKEAWEKSEGRGVRYLDKSVGYIGSEYTCTMECMPVEDAMSDCWEPIPPPEPPKPEKLTLAQALRKWGKVRRPFWHEPGFVWFPGCTVVTWCGCVPLLGDLEATDWVEAKP